MFKKQILALALCLPFCIPAAAHAQATCPLELLADLPVTYVAGHIPVITAQIDGQAVSMEVDTGSSGSYLTRQTYDSLNLNGTFPTTGRYAQGVGGTMQINTALEEDLTLGHTTVKDEIFGLADTATVLSHDGKPLVGGVIGDDILDSYNIGLDLPDNRISLYQAQPCSAGITPWPGDYAPMPITRNKEMMVSTIDYGIDNTTLAAVIDTGSDHTLVTAQALARTGTIPLPGSPGGTDKIEGIGANILTTTIQIFASVTLGAETFDNMAVLVGRSNIVRFNDALIGEDYLATHRVFISNATDTDYLGLTVAPAN